MKGYHFAIFEASSCLQTHDHLAAFHSDNFCGEKARVLNERKSTCEDFQLFLLLKSFITHIELTKNDTKNLGPVHTKTIVNANDGKRKLFYAFTPSVHTKTMKTLTVNA